MQHLSLKRLLAVLLARYIIRALQRLLEEECRPFFASTFTDLVDRRTSSFHIFKAYPGLKSYDTTLLSQ